MDLGIFASNVFVFVFFYEKNILDFLKRREKIIADSFCEIPLFSNMGRGGEEGKQVLRSEPGAGRIVYDNGWPNLIRPVLARFTELFREEQFRIAQAEIMSVSGLSISIALTEGVGV